MRKGLSCVVFVVAADVAFASFKAAAHVDGPKFIITAELEARKDHVERGRMLAEKVIKFCKHSIGNAIGKSTWLASTSCKAPSIGRERESSTSHGLMDI